MPPLFLSPAPDAPAADYRRQARRLRARFANNPARLHPALRHLAQSEDARPRLRPPDDAGHRLPGHQAGPAQRFSARVSVALSAGVLRYSARKQLLREAADLGLGQFEATLLIAAVQHGERRSSITATVKPSRRSRSTALITLTAVTLQTLIAAAAWWVMHA